MSTHTIRIAVVLVLRRLLVMPLLRAATVSAWESPIHSDHLV